jgi:predicted aldo/keto reductase-like oxidoreductase
METREVGSSGVRLSVVGFGTAQLQMLPERQAVAAMRRAFELGINWVHTAPDYGGVEHWIARAIRESGREVTVATQCPAQVELLEPFFDNARAIFGRDTLDLYGVNCIEDIEYVGENVWGAGGTIDRLQRRKRAGQVRALFCSTHGPIDYMERLVTCGVFDAVMVAYNPLEFHLLTYYAAKIGRRFESLRAIRERLFPLAAAHGVSVIVMKPLAAGLLTRGRAFPPAAWPAARGQADDAVELDATELLRHALAHPGVCAVVPGIASIEEAEQDARAGYAPTSLAPARAAAIEAAAAEMRLSLCSRCGECETTCSRGLPISSMFRDAYIWSYGNETFMADDRENYFALHPAAVLACAECDNRSCLCPQGLEVPRALADIHDTMRTLRASGRHPGPIDQLAPPVTAAPHVPLVVSREILWGAGTPSVARFLVQNAGDAMWTAVSHIADPAVAVAVGVSIDGVLTGRTPLRQNISPGQRSPVVVEFDAPPDPGAHRVDFHLMPLGAPALDRSATPLFSITRR